MARVLVVGAKEGSLGSAIVDCLADREFLVATAGISGEPTILDVTDPYPVLMRTLREVGADHIVVTAGINMPPNADMFAGARDPLHWYGDHFVTNCTGPMRLLEAWLEVRAGAKPLAPPGHFVAISSNSAHIARTGSAAYCASKAALSMAIRCKAREIGRKGLSVIAYGYEPGLLAGTPMTRDVEDRADKEWAPKERLALHRMPGIDQEGISPDTLAGLIAYNIANGGRELNSTMHRIDSGEQ